MKDKLSLEELVGKLGAMYAYAIAHMQTVGVSEGKRKEFARAHREMKSIIKQHFKDNWHIINVRKELGKFYGKPIPEEKRNELINRYKILFHDVAESNIEPLIRKLIDELKEGK